MGTETKTVTKDWELTPEKFLTTDELGRLLQKAEELWVLGETKKRKALVRDAFLIHTAIYSGLRCSEVCDLKVTDLRIGNGQAHLLVRKGKGGKQRTVHLGGGYKRTLKLFLKWKLDQGELHQDSYLLRTERSERYCASGLWRRWKKYCPKTLHCARHTNATLLYQASGNNLRAVQRQLGHSRITTTQIYADVMPELMRESMTAMERLAATTKRGIRPAYSG
jgi:integrase